MYSVCILIYVSMYLYSYPSTHSIYGLATGGAWEQFEVRLKMMIQWTQTYTPWFWSSEFSDAIGDWEWVNSEMDWEAMIEWIWRYTSRQRLSELRDALQGWDWTGLEMHLSQAMIKQDWRSTWRWLIWWQSMGGTPGAEPSIHQLINSKPWECDEVTLPLRLRWRTSWWRSIGREVCRKLNLHSGVNLKSWKWRDDWQS